MKRIVELILEKVAQKEISSDTAYSLIYKYKKENDISDYNNIRTNQEEPFKFKDVAVIGMSCRFSGADTPEAFWNNLENGADSVREVPEERWQQNSYYSKDRTEPLTSYSKWGSFIDSMGMFDPGFFNVKEEYAQLIDPLQRLFLMLSWEVIEHAGYGSKASRADKTIGVFVGARGNSYQIYEELKKHVEVEHAQKEKIEIVRAGLLGKAPNMIAASIADFMDLQGPAMVIDTACSSSLVSIHTACRSLNSGECRMAIAGGVDLLLTPELYVYLSQIKAISPDGKCKTFDADANGYVPGEGGGAVLLKPLDEAIRDGDRVYAVIKGSYVNNDGFTVGVTTPDVKGQKKVINGALKAAGISPETVSMLEAHGTGTFIGDPIEIKALTEVYREYTSRENYCAIGAVKTNIGHLHSAAGIASFIKVVMSLHSKKIPRTLNCNKPNPRFDLVSSPFYIAGSTEPWEGINGVRRAGISSFGFGGTNCHMILEEKGENNETSLVKSPPKSSFMLAVSAKTKKALAEKIRLYARSMDSISEGDLPNFCFTANTGREVFPYRLALNFKSYEDAKNVLKEASRGLDNFQSCKVKMHYGFAEGDKEIKTAFLFPGQGSQYPGMARELYDTEQNFRNSFDRCSLLLEPYLGFKLAESIYSGNFDQQALSQTSVSQPLVFAIGYSLAKMWIAWGIKPSAVMGHSVGEYTAACIAGVLSLEDAVKLVVLRGSLMQKLKVGGGMRVVFAGCDAVMGVVAKQDQQFPGQIAVAGINGPANTVVSGSLEALKVFEEVLKSNSITVRELSVSHPFHSPMMEPIVEEYSGILDTVNFNTPKIAIISNVTGEYLNNVDKTYWCNHILKPVDFHSSVNCLLNDGFDILLEVGPGTTLLSMVKHIVKDKKDILLASTLNPSQSDWQSVYGALSKIFAWGLDVNFASIENGRDLRRILLPLYPFELRKYWIAQSFKFSTASSAVYGEQEQVFKKEKTGAGGLKLLEASNGKFVFERILDSEKETLLANHKVNGTTILPGVYYWELVRAAAQIAFGDEISGLYDVIHLAPVKITKGYKVTLNIEIEDRLKFVVRSFVEGCSDKWILNAKGGILNKSSINEKVQIEVLKRKFAGKYMPGSQVLETFSRRGLEYGPEFFAIKGLWCKDVQAFCEIQLPMVGSDVTSGFIDHPALIDAALQAAVGLNRLQKADRAYLPFSVKSVVYNGRVSPTCYGYVKLVNRLRDGMTEEVDVKVIDDKGFVRVAVNGLELKASGGGADIKDTDRSEIKNWFYMPYWRYVSVPHVTSQGPVKKLVVFCNENGINAQIVRTLKARGHQIVRVKAGSGFTGEMQGEYTLNPFDIRQYDVLFDSLAQNHANLDGIVHLWNIGDGRDGMDDLESLMGSQYMGCLSLVHIIKAFRHHYKHEGFLLTVSSSTLPVTGDETRLSPEKATMLGIIKTIPIEYGNMKCAFMDIDNSDSNGKDLGELIADEIEKGIRNEIGAWRKGQKYVMGIKQAKIAHDSKNSSFKAGGVYLIAGGLGGLGMEVAKHIAAKVPARLVLINRTPMPPRSAWDSWLVDKGPEDKTSIRIKTIRQVEQKGSEVQTYSGDICDYYMMKGVVGEIKEKYGQIDGIINSTIVLNDLLIRNMTEEDMKEVLRPKLLGSWILDKVTSGEQLDFFIMFSGMVTYFANAGQSNYACGSFFQDAFAHYRTKKDNKNTIVINWGIWGETGIVSQPFYIEKLISKGVRPIRTVEGIEAFERIMGLGLTQVGVAPLDQNLQESLVDRGDNKNSEKNPPDEQLNHWGQVRPGHVVAAGTARSAWKPADTKKTEMMLTAEIKKLLGKMTAALLNKEVGTVSTKLSFLDLGLDSIAIVSMTESFEKEFGLKLYPTLFFEYASINELTGYLTKNHRDSFTYLLDISEANAAEISDAGLLVTDASSTEVSGFTEDCKKDTYDNSIDKLFQSGAASDIAIIGMAGIFPGAENINEFWSNILNGVESVRNVSPDRWDANVYYSENRQPGKTYCKRGGFVDGIELFDQLFFNISPKEANSMDPQQRLALKTAWHALEDAGYGGNKLHNSKTGVYVGVSSNNYYPVAFDPNNNYSGLGTSSSIIPNRISYFMDFRGPSVCVETQCSSSLVAIHNACQAIMSGDCDQAVAGGVNLIISPEYYILLSQMEALSPDGRCFAFDKRANGFVDGEGIGIVILKKLDDALRDRDNIYAVIKSTHLNHDGHSSSLTAPNSNAQAELIKEAIQKSGVDAETISYIEAHGTGTALGDPIEIKGITKAYEAFTDKKAFCAIGSVKTNVGHLEAASGIAGLIKVVMAMKNRILPKSLNFESPNPFIDFNGSPVYLLDRNTAWETTNYPLRASVSSFGMGGTNAHVILEEPGPPHYPPVQANREMHVVTFSAKSEKSLRYTLEKFNKFLEVNNDLDIENVCYTLNTGRGHFNHRVCMVVKNLIHLQQNIKGLLENDFAYAALKHEGVFHQATAVTGPENKGVYGVQNGDLKTAIVFSFPAINRELMASQGMGRDLYSTETVFRQAVDECVGVFNGAGCPLADYFKNRDNWSFTEINYPFLIFTLQYSIYKLYSAWGIKIESFMGTGCGKITAAVADGSITMQEASDYLFKKNYSYFDSYSFEAGKHNAEATVHIGEPGEGIVMPLISNQKNETQLVQEILAQLYVWGCDIDWESFDREYARIKLSLPLYVFDERRCWVHNKTTVSQTANALADSKKTIEADAVEHYLYKWNWVKAEESSSVGTLKRGIWVVFTNGFGLSPLICRQLSEMGQVVIRVIRGGLFKRFDSNSFIIDPQDYESYRTLFELVVKDFSGLDGILHLWSCDKYRDRLSDTAMLEEGFFDGIYSIFFISKAISRLGIRNKLRILAVTAFGMLIPAAGGAFAPERYPVQVALRVVSAEMPNVNCTYIDFDLDDSSCDDIASQVLNEIRCNYGLREVVYRGMVKWTRKLVPIKPNPLVGTYKWKKDGVYLITGGASGIGALISLSLAEKASSGLVLIGQKELPPPEAWDELIYNENDSTVAERIKLIKRLEGMGSRVLYYTVDVCDSVGMKKVLTDAEEKLGSVTGVFHCAGIKSDASIENKDFAGLKSVLNPKVKGTLVLKEIFKDKPPGFVIMFSSIASLYGSAGQYDYSSSNAFMDSLSSNDQFGPDCSCISINWPLWVQGGMELGNANRRRMKDDGMLPISGSEGFEIIEKVLVYDIQNAAVLKLNDRETFLSKLEARFQFNDMENDWLLEENVGQDVSKIEDQEIVTEDLSHDVERPSDTASFLRDTFSQLLAMQSDELDDDTEFGYYGMDSLAIKDAMYRVEKHYGQTMEPSIFEEYPTITKLTAYLEQYIGNSPIKTEGADMQGLSHGAMDKKTLALRKVLMDLYSGKDTPVEAKIKIINTLKS